MLNGILPTQLTEYPVKVNLGTRMFFELGNPVLLNPVFISGYQFYFYPKIKRHKRVIT